MIGAASQRKFNLSGPEPERTATPYEILCVNVEDVCHVFALVQSTMEFSYEGHPYIYRVPKGFHIDIGEKVCISGVSGSGKSTILTMLAGLRRLSKGEIRYDFKPRPASPWLRSKFWGRRYGARLALAFSGLSC
jgi:ABC-type glutathione transport system ATPase component